MISFQHRRLTEPAIVSPNAYDTGESEMASNGTAKPHVQGQFEQYKLFSVSYVLSQ